MHLLAPVIGVDTWTQVVSLITKIIIINVKVASQLCLSLLTLDFISVFVDSMNFLVTISWILFGSMYHKIYFDSTGNNVHWWLIELTTPLVAHLMQGIWLSDMLQHDCPNFSIHQRSSHHHEKWKKVDLFHACALVAWKDSIPARMAGTLLIAVECVGWWVGTRRGFRPYTGHRASNG